MAGLIHTRNADLQIANDEKGLPPPYDPADYSTKLFTIAQNEKDIWGPSGSRTTSVKFNGSKRRKRGRPRVELDPRTERGLIRLFVSSPTPLERITNAIKNLDGPR